MNALIFLVPEDIVDVRPRLVRIFWLRFFSHRRSPSRTDHDVRRQSHGHRAAVSVARRSRSRFPFVRSGSDIPEIYPAGVMEVLKRSEARFDVVLYACGDVSSTMLFTLAVLGAVGGAVPKLNCMNYLGSNVGDSGTTSMQSTIRATSRYKTSVRLRRLNRPLPAYMPPFHIRHEHFFSQNCFRRCQAAGSLTNITPATCRCGEQTSRVFAFLLPQIGRPGSTKQRVRRGRESPGFLGVSHRQIHGLRTAHRWHEARCV